MASSSSSSSSSSESLPEPKGWFSADLKFTPDMKVDVKRLGSRAGPYPARRRDGHITVSTEAGELTISDKDARLQGKTGLDWECSTVLAASVVADAIGKPVDPADFRPFLIQLEYPVRWEVPVKRDLAWLKKTFPKREVYPVGGITLLDQKGVSLIGLECKDPYAFNGKGHVNIYRPFDRNLSFEEAIAEAKSMFEDALRRLSG